MERLTPDTLTSSRFVSLLSGISKVATKTQESNFTGSSTSETKDYPALRVFSRWVAYLRKTFEHKAIEDSSMAIFQLLFPDMDVNRRYDMQEARLAQHLARIFGVSSNSGGRGLCLLRWSTDGLSGCLGIEVREILAAAVGISNQHAGLSISQIDRLLTQLASLSSFSHSSVQQNPNLPSSRVETLKTLYSTLSPTEASFLTQIILKDLRPVLYPSKETHYTAALKQQKSNSVVFLDVVDALKVWDPTLNALSRWRVVSSFQIALSNDDCGLMFIGNPLQIPKTVKGTGCAQALKLFSDSRLVWAETKYDGERAQIHVKVDQRKGSVELKIFSKSKRESTNDRHAVHQVILDALGLPGSVVPPNARNGMPCVMSDVILEAEMVAFSDSSGRIDEFWRIRSLVESTAVGPRHKGRKMHEETPVISQCSLRSDASDGGTRHLALVFFDVLLLDSRPLTSLPYHERRKIMESIVLPIPGFSLLAERSPIDITKGIDAASVQLKTVFAHALADHQEGLVLKADEGAYIKSPWVKLKKDYIPGLGDCVDLVIVGACWEKDRGRELRVPPSAFTTFCLGMLVNADALRNDPSTTPSFRAFFSTSYGLSRDQLEDLNFLIKSSNSMTYDEYCSNPHRLGYDMSLFIGQSQPKPSVVILKDSLILAEVFSAGFTKPPGGKYYELRFPRMTKAYRRRDRTWRECISLEEFQRIARETVGRERPNKEADDWCKNLFGGVASPGIKHPLRRKQREE
ncbi:DNA ligase/mRNA capping enzyme, partial [Thelephora ganbajun]